LREVLRVRRTVLGEEHALVAGALSNIGIGLLELHDIAGAEQAQEEALRIQRKVLSDGDPDVAITLQNLGDVLRAKGDLDGGEQSYREAVRIWRDYSPEGHPDLPKGLDALATVFRAKGDDSGAAAVTRQRAYTVLRQVETALAANPGDPTLLGRRDDALDQLRRLGDHNTMAPTTRALRATATRPTRWE
jgi:tetratricopeptide (TPR) repeat protein